MLRIASVTIDCHDLPRLTEFWSKALGYVGTVEADGDSATVEDPKDRDVEIVLICAPEGKIVKNRVHIDLGADDMDAEVDRLMDLGAERVERIKTWTMMRDPEDNEFCVVQADEKDPVSGWRP